MGENNLIFYLAPAAAGFLLCLAATPVVRALAWRCGLVDEPSGERKIHGRATALGGGAAVFAAYFIVLFFVRDRLVAGELDLRHWLGVFIGSAWLIAGGWLDDKYALRPGRQIIFPLLAVLSVLAGGVEISKITNPFGGFVDFNAWHLPIPLPLVGTADFYPVAAVFVFLWLMGMMYTTKLLDGVDGLVTGVTAIGALIIFLFTVTTKYYQPDIALAAVVLVGVALAFLIFNWHPASVFLGEGGSLWFGFILGVLAVISGGKIAIALLVMGIPILDVAWTIIRRLASGRNPFRFADRRHLHFRLLDIGLGQRGTAAAYFAVAAAFGLSVLWLQSRGKMLALAALVAIMFLLVIALAVLDHYRRGRTGPRV